MILQRFNSVVKIAQCSREEWNWLDATLAFRDEDAYHAKAGRETFLNPRQETFPAGLLPLVEEIALGENIPFTVLDGRKKITPIPNVDFGWLRDYQKEALAIGLKEERGIYWLATGAGKTEIAIALATALPVRTAFVVDSVDIALQTADRWEKRTGEQAGRIGAGYWDERRFTVCTFKTLFDQRGTSKGQAFLRSVGMLIVDEAHTLPAETFYATAQDFTEARYRFGLSATPIHSGDKRSLRSIAALGPVIMKLKPRDVWEMGFIAWPNITMVSLEQHSARLNYAGVYRECVVDSPERNAIAASLIQAAPQPALVLVEQVDHGKNMVHRLQRLGVRADYVDGTDDQISRSNAVKNLIRGDLDVVVSTRIFGKGKDIPALRTVFRLAAMKSAVSAVQGLGRGSRLDVASGKEEFEYVDFYDTGHKWLMRHSKARKRSYEREGYVPIVLTPQEALIALQRRNALNKLPTSNSG